MKLFVGKRYAGKTHLAIRELLEKAKKGDTVGVIGASLIHSFNLKSSIEKIIPKDFITVKTISLDEIDTVDLVLIDQLDMVLPDNCICTSGNVYNVKSTNSIDIEPYEEKYITYKEIENVIDCNRYSYMETNEGKLKFINLEELELNIKTLETTLNMLYELKQKLK